MESIANIPAKSKQEAMDWSLVLASQGIDHKIECSELNEWRLEVIADEEQRALGILRRYKWENRRWMWQREIIPQGPVFDWAALLWVAIITVFFWASSEAPTLKTVGAMDSFAVRAGEWWRLFTAVWLHADLGHLAGNASIGILLVGLCLGLYGTGTGMLSAYVAGVGGNVIALVTATTSPHRSLGASGLVMGCIGLMAAHALLIRGPNRVRILATSCAAALMLFVLLGLGQGTDVVAHAGGAASGFLIGVVLAFVRTRTQNPTLNIVCGGAFLVLTIVPWSFALAR